MYGVLIIRSNAVYEQHMRFDTYHASIDLPLKQACPATQS